MKTFRKILNVLFFLMILVGSIAMGPGSTAAVGQKEHDLMREKVLRTFMSKLPANKVHFANSIADTIMDEYTIHKIDPMMITAIISGESSFNPSAIGPIGEIGLMQLRPRTAKWIADKTGIQWKGAWALRDPVYNIRLGSAYLGYLKRKYSPKEGMLYLAAYNMGETKLLKHLSNNVSPNIYSSHIMKNYYVINI